MTVAFTAALVAGIAFAGLVVFQIALALGAPWGRAAYGGQNVGRLPGSLRIASVVAAALWAAVALVVARAGGIPVWAPLPDGVIPVAIWVIVGMLAIAVVLNAITRSRLERAIWVPLTLVMLAATLVVALATPV